MDHAKVIEATRRWIADIVIGLNLCPFARQVFDADRIRFVVSTATDEAALLRELEAELKLLAEAPDGGPETTLLIHPAVLTNFLDFNDFLDPVEQLVADLDFDGIIQVASFHPDYQFGETLPDDVENFTNRSPFPMLHLLREESVTRVQDYPGGLDAIPERNIQKLRQLGRDAILEKLKNITG
jgi:uncharacterized protein